MAAAALVGSILGFAIVHGTALLGFLGQLGHLRAAGGRHLAVVRAPARHRGGHLRQRQLRGRRDLAAIVQQLVDSIGWRGAYNTLAIVSAVVMPLLALALRAARRRQ